MTARRDNTDWVALAASPGRKSPIARILRFVTRAYLRFRTRGAPTYAPTSDAELAEIEARLESLGIACEGLVVEPTEFQTFIQRFQFPDDYYGGLDSGIYEEKMLEHFLAWKLLELDVDRSGTYVDIAACASPWARRLREEGVAAYAIDLELAPSFSHLDYYRQEDATRSNFPECSVRGASLQCAFEMFTGDQDQALVVELSRILLPGGRAVVSPLYMHTHASYYQTPEHFGSPAGDRNAKAYVRRDAWGITASRKYSPETLLARVWNPAISHGLHPRLLILRNKRELGDAIYLHFILVLEKPGEETR